MGRLDIPTNHRSTEGLTPEVDLHVEWVKEYEQIGDRTVYMGRSRELISAEFARDLERRLRDANAECAVRNDEVTGLQGQLRARADAWAEKFQAECKRSDEYMNADFQSRGKLAAAERALEEAQRDAGRFQYLQNAPIVEAQAFFWNYGSRTERRKAIDAAIAARRQVHG